MLHVPYTGVDFKLPDELVAGNSKADVPVVFSLEPAWGPDLARIKSVIFAVAGLADLVQWTPEVQDAVTKAFDHGAGAFVNTITKITGLTVPARMALRAGLIQAIPTRVFPGQTTAEPDPDAPVPVTTGVQFSRICGAGPLLAVAMTVAGRIAALSDEAQIDPRFFAQPSGSGGPGTQPATATTAGNARPTSRRRGTAGKRGKTAGSTQKDSATLST